MRAIADKLTRTNYEIAVALANVPDAIRGYGPVKTESAAAAREERMRLELAFADARRTEPINAA